MLKRYDGIEMEIVYLNHLDIVTASGDRYEEDPWVGFEQ